jgi:hypothetical protein
MVLAFMSKIRGKRKGLETEHHLMRVEKRR